MEICRIQPLTDPRWEAFLNSHPEASVFHTPGWLEALHRTYGYEPIVYALLGRQQQIVSGIPFCRIRSRLTGRRLVSLPFSDHCQPLTRSEDELHELLTAAELDARLNGCKYVEIRPLVSDESRIRLATHLTRSNTVLVHKLDLTQNEADLVQGFHKDCIRRKIARTGRNPLRYEEGQSEELLRKFYHLQLLTRRRHQIPPQPLGWFRNLIDCLGSRLKIRMVSSDETPIASIITLSFNNVVIDKYSCSDPKFNALGGMVFLIWRLIQEARSEGLSELDLGRSDYNTPGLITFKDRWGAMRCPVTYYRCPAPAPRPSINSSLVAAGKRLLTAVPDSMFGALGGFLYRHVG
jgi:CelD/BcsL family acetyltransferase involved in cellulose biosynthesis